MNKMVLFTDDVFKRLYDEDEAFPDIIDLVDIHVKSIIFETCRIFNFKQKVVELVFSAVLFEEPTNIQFSVLVALNDVEDEYEILHMLPDDYRRTYLSDTLDKYIVATHLIKKPEHDEYNTDYYYYLIDKNIENKNVYKLNISITEQMIISKVISMANRGYLLNQYGVSDIMNRDNVRDFVTLKHNPNDEYEIIDHHFTKVSKNMGVLSVIFKFDNIETYNRYFLLSINISENKKIFKELTKKNKYKNKEQFLESLNSEKYRDIQLIQFDNDCINIDYVAENRFNPESKPITRSFFYGGDIIFDILMHERANLFEKIINTYL